MSEAAQSPLLVTEDLHVSLGWRSAAQEILRGISLSVGPGETLGLVGESGSGKTTFGRAVLGLVPVSAGRVMYAGRDITHLSPKKRRLLGRELQVVFQDPFTSLNPAMQIRDILMEPLVAQGVNRAQANERVRDLLGRVALPANSLSRYAREFSGGQRQRIGIARALALNPRLIVCDEPVSALDVSIQRRVLDLLIEIQESTNVAYLFISHDLAVVRHVSHRVAVMYRGDIVEDGAVQQVTERPQHAYTQRLSAASLVADPERQAERRELRHAARTSSVSSGAGE